MTVYLCGSGVFLDPEVKDLLERIIRPIVDGNLPVPLQMERSDSPSRLSSFLGMFSELVRIFCSESYGDETFARTLFHFTRNCYDSRFRDVVWEEAAVFASALENCAPDSLDQYIFETFPDAGSIKYYVEFLTSICLSPIYVGGFMYNIALRNIRSYLDGRSQTDAADVLRKIVLFGSKKILQDLINITPESNRPLQSLFDEIAQADTNIG
eukprot:249194_1